MRNGSRDSGAARRWLATAGAILLAGCASPTPGGSARAQSPYSPPATLPPALLPAAPAPVETPGALRLTKPAGESRVVEPAAATTTTAAGPITQSQVKLTALVNGNPVYESEVAEAVAQRAGELYQLADADRRRREREVRDEELKRLVERELVIDDMFTKLKKAKSPMLQVVQDEAVKDADKRLRDFRKSRNIPTEEEFKALLATQGLSHAGMRRQMMRSYMMTEYVRNLVGPRVNRVTLAEIRDYYDEHPDEFVTKDKVAWQDLFLRWDKFPSPDDARKFAAQVVSQARAGADFVALVKQHDHGDSSFRNGVGLGTARGEIRPEELEPTLFALQSGQVGNPVEMDGGLHVVKVTERTVAGSKPFSQATQAEIRKKLGGKMADVEIRRILRDLKDKATIVYYDTGEAK